MPSYKGIDYLAKYLAIKRIGVLKRYKYYDMKNTARDLSGVIPKEFNWLLPVLGWCAKAADSVAERIIFESFKNDSLNFNEIFDLNNKDILTDSAVNSSLITSCCFIYISKNQDGFPRLQVIDGGNATGIIDPVTRMLTEGYAVLERDDMGNPLTEAYFTAEATYIYRSGKADGKPYSNPTGYPLLVPMINHPDPRKAFGRSRITRACMELTDSAIRTLKRSEVAAEFYSFPQKYALGLEDSAKIDRWRATVSSFLRMDKDSDGDHPVVGQFQQQSMQPFNDQLRTIASMFAGETGLTLDDLGFSTANPTTSEAIRASHETLRRAARKSQRDLSVGFLNAGFLAACLRDNYRYDRSIIAKSGVSYEPVFEPDASQLSGLGDAVNKIQQSFPDYFTEEKLHELTGL